MKDPKKKVLLLSNHANFDDYNYLSIIKSEEFFVFSEKEESNEL